MEIGGLKAFWNGRMDIGAIGIFIDVVLRSHFLYNCLASVYTADVFVDLFRSLRPLEITVIILRQLSQPKERIGQKEGSNKQNAQNKKKNADKNISYCVVISS